MALVTQKSTMPGAAGAPPPLPWVPGTMIYGMRRSGAPLVVGGWDGAGGLEGGVCHPLIHTRTHSTLSVPPPLHMTPLCLFTGSIIEPPPPSEGEARGSQFTQFAMHCKLPWNVSGLSRLWETTGPCTNPGTLIFPVQFF